MVISVLNLDAIIMIFKIMTEVVDNIVNPNTYNLITLIIASTLGWGGSIINGRIERKKIRTQYAEQQKQITERDRIMMDQMRGFDNKLVQLSMDFLEHKKNNEFKSRLMNMMRTKATNIIDYNVDLDSKYKHLLMKIAREFEDFAFRFYYSDMRGIEHEITQFLRIDMESRVAAIENIIRRINSKPKKYTYGTGKKKSVYFIDLVKESKLNKEIEVLLIILQRNGLSPERVIEVFEKFISNYFKEFLTIVNQWDELEEWKKDELIESELSEIDKILNDK